MKIGDRCFVRGYIDEIRKDTVIVRNDGGYFGTVLSEVTGELPSAQPEQSNSSEFWRKRADFYSDMCMNLIGEMGKGVKVESVQISENGIAFIKEQPSAQPEIIACGDCKHWICHDRRCGYWNHGVKPLDWCCHAERRNDGQKD